MYMGQTVAVMQFEDLEATAPAPEEQPTPVAEPAEQPVEIDEPALVPAN